MLCPLPTVQKTASAMVAEGAPFRGVLFAGLMIREGKVITLPPDDPYIPHRMSPLISYTQAACEE